MEKCKGKKASGMSNDSWSWTQGWLSYSAFEGTTYNGANAHMKKSLVELKDMIKNAINFEYSPDGSRKINMILIDQLDKSYEQAVGWLESLGLLYKTMQKGQMSEQVAWQTCLIYSMALFEDIKMVRHVSAKKNESWMIWGSFHTMELLAEYVRLNYIQHPQVSSILVLTAMQHEGRDINAMEDKVGAVDKKFDDIEKRVKKLEDFQSNLFKKNPTLN
jgi:hypothetical protein